MAVTTVGSITSGGRTLTVTGGTFPVTTLVRIDDEAIRIAAYQPATAAHGNGRRQDPQKWVIERGANGTTAASHSNGATVTALVPTFGDDAFDDEGGSGGSQTLAQTLALGNDANQLRITNAADGVDPSDMATVGQLGGGGGLGTPQPTLADLGVASPPMWAAQTQFLIAGVMYESYGPAFYQSDGWVLAAEDYQGSGAHTGDDPPDLTGLGVGDSVTDGTYTSHILAAVEDWPPTPATWATGQTYGLTSFVWPTEADGSLWGPYPGYDLSSDPATDQPAFGSDEAANFLYVTDPATAGYWMRWGAANGAFGGAMPALRGQSLDIMAQGDGVPSTAYVSSTSDTLAWGYLFVTGVRSADGNARVASFTDSGSALSSLYANRYGVVADFQVRVDASGQHFQFIGLPTSDPATAGDLWCDPDADFVVKVSQG